MLLALTWGLLLVQEARAPPGGTVVREAWRAGMEAVLTPPRYDGTSVVAAFARVCRGPSGGGAAHVLHLLWTLSSGATRRVFVAYAPPLCPAVGGGGAAAARA